MISLALCQYLVTFMSGHSQLVDFLLQTKLNFPESIHKTEAGK